MVKEAVDDLIGIVVIGFQVYLLVVFYFTWFQSGVKWFSIGLLRLPTMKEFFYSCVVYLFEFLDCWFQYWLVFCQVNAGSISFAISLLYGTSLIPSPVANIASIN